MPEPTDKKGLLGGLRPRFGNSRSWSQGWDQPWSPWSRGLCGAPAGLERWGCLVFQTETQLPSASQFWLFILIPCGWRRALPTPPPITQGRLRRPPPVLRGWDTWGAGSCQESELSH